MRNVLITIITLALLVNLVSCQAKPAQEDQTSQTAIADSLQVSETPAEWFTDYQKAMQTAKEKKLPMLVNFTGSDWCVWCKRLSKEVFTEKAFLDYAKDHFILVKLDFPQNLPQSDAEKQQNEALAKQFGIEGFPTIILISPEGREITRTGYQQGGAENYIKHLESLLQQ